MEYEKYVERRNSMCLSDYQVSKMTGVSRATLSQWKNGNSIPSKATIERLEKLFSEQSNENITASTGGFSEKDLLPTSYIVNLGDGNKIELTKDEYTDLQRAIKAYIKVWLETKK